MLTEDGRPGGTFLIFFGGVSRHGGEKKTNHKRSSVMGLKVLALKQSYLREAGLLQCCFKQRGWESSGSFPRSPTPSGCLTQHCVLRPPTSGRVQTIELGRRFDTGRGQAVGTGHVSWQELRRKEESNSNVNKKRSRNVTFQTSQSFPIICE